MESLVETPSLRASRSVNVALVSSFTAAIVVTRILLAPFPNIKPTTFLVAMVGILFGPRVGFSVGLLSIAITDISFFGAGYHTLVDSPCMGGLGLASGLLWGGKKDLSRFELAIGGFLLTLIWDVVTSLLGFILYFPTTESALTSALVGLFLPTPYPLGPAHELSTAALMGLLGVPIVKAIRQRRGW